MDPFICLFPTELDVFRYISIAYLFLQVNKDTAISFKISSFQTVNSVNKRFVIRWFLCSIY